MRNRYYSPTLSRFVSSDPIGFGGGDANLFRYVGGDPVNSSDPLGTVISGGVGFGIACCTFGGPSDFALDGISFDFSQLGVALAGQGLTLAVNSGAGLTVGGGSADISGQGQILLAGRFGVFEPDEGGGGAPSESFQVVPPASAPVGSINEPLPRPLYQPRLNAPGLVGDRPYSGHAFDKMQMFGIPPSVVEETIKSGESFPGKNGVLGFHSPHNGMTVLVDPKTGLVITVYPGH